LGPNWARDDDATNSRAANAARERENTGEAPGGKDFASGALPAASFQLNWRVGHA
jgi:hypothetical protein